MGAVTTVRQEKHRLLWRLVDLASNAALLLLLFFAYWMVRRVTADDWSEALTNARSVIVLQSALGLPDEAVIQSTFLDRPLLFRLANTFYIYAHFPVTGAFMAWVWLRHRSALPRIRMTFILVTMSGLAIHLIYPLAPPRMMPGYVDTGAIFGPSPYDNSAAEMANQLAAMPSLHVGWALLSALGVVTLCRSTWRYLALVHPFVTTAVVILTANHYWVDALIAVALVIVAWVLVMALRPVRNVFQDANRFGVDRQMRLPSPHSQVR